MAIFRKIHTSYWSDTYIQTLSPEQKYFFLYLLTNEKTRQCGIYEISKKQIAYDTGYNIDTVSILLKYFMDTKKIVYSESTNEICILNWRKYNENVSKKVQVLVDKELKLVKNKSLIQYLYSIDRVPILKPQEEEEEEEELEQEDDDGKGGSTYSKQPLPLVVKTEIKPPPTPTPPKVQKVITDQGVHTFQEPTTTVYPKLTQTDLAAFKQRIIADQMFLETLRMARPVGDDAQVGRWIDWFNLNIVSQEKLWKDFSEYKNHFRNWVVLQDFTKPPKAVMVPPKRKTIDEIAKKYDT